MARMGIGDFARATGLTPKALRLYDEMDLLRPAAVEEANGYRYYEPDQLDRARLVARLRLVGMPLERIRQLADLQRPELSAELLSWWRQVEADHVSRRGQVALLVDESREEEQQMDIDQEQAVTVASRTGPGRRELQLDAISTDRGVFAVADGFGPDPDVSRDVLACLGRADVEGPIEPLAFLDAAVARANAAVAGRPDSGSTLTALLLGDGRAAVAHVGDTRLCLVREGRLQRMTRDHTFVQALVDEGRLTPEEARAEEDRVLLNRAICASDPAQPDIAVFATQPGDRFVLTSDGVHGMLEGSVLADLLTRPAGPEDVASAVETAVLAAGAPDNYAVLVIDL